MVDDRVAVAKGKMISPCSEKLRERMCFPKFTMGIYMPEMEFFNHPMTAKESNINYPFPHIPHKTSLLWRLFDFFSALFLLLFTIPILLLICILISLTSDGPVFFLHRRVGQKGRFFNCIKFRTMKANSDAILEEHLRKSASAKLEWDCSYKLKNDPRVTQIGGIMRKLSLDEIPQLFNVLSGEMSLVGPRPIVEEEIIRYGSNFEYYCRVRPGITGLWQTSGRSSTSYHARIEMDISYIRQKSIIFDLWLAIKTIPVIISSRGAC